MVTDEVTDCVCVAEEGVGDCDGFEGAASLSSSYCSLYILYDTTVSFSVWKQIGLDLHLGSSRPQTPLITPEASL